jgi:hypothetical protein
MVMTTIGPGAAIATTTAGIAIVGTIITGIAAIVTGGENEKGSTAAAVEPIRCKAPALVGLELFFPRVPTLEPLGALSLVERHQGAAAVMAGCG